MHLCYTSFDFNFIKLKLSLTKMHFVGLHYMIILQCTVQKTLKKTHTPVVMCDKSLQT